MFFPFITLKYCAIPFGLVEFLLKNQLITLCSSLVCCLFSPLLLSIFYLCLFLSVWLLSALVCSSLHLFSLWLSELCRLGWLFISPCYRSFQILSFRIFSWVLSLFSFWTSYIVNLGLFTVVPEVSYAVLIFFLYSILQQWLSSSCLPSHLFILFFCLSYSATDSFQLSVHLCLFVL